MSGRASRGSAPVFDLPNLRDVGGAITADGRRVRRGLVYRGPALAWATPSDLELLRGLGLRTVVDLRSEPERQWQPEAALLPAATAYVVGLPWLQGARSRRSSTSGRLGRAAITR